MSDLVLVFDLDGTLINSAPDIHANVNRVMGEHAIAGFTLDQVRGFIGGGVDILIARCLAARDLPTDGAQHRQMAARFIEIYDSAHGLTTLYPHVAEVLAALPNPLAICTNKPEGPTRSVLGHFNLAHHFKVIVGGDTLAEKKPDPAPLHAAIAGMGNHPALFIGDSEVDAATAHAAGVPFLLFTEGYRHTPVEDLGAAASFSDWRDLPALVAQHTR